MSDQIWTPQAYPLACASKDGRRYLVVGWDDEGAPVVVPMGLAGSHYTTSINADVTYYLPGKPS